MLTGAFIQRHMSPQLSLRAPHLLCQLPPQPGENGAQGVFPRTRAHGTQSELFTWPASWMTQCKHPIANVTAAKAKLTLQPLVWDTK